MDNSEIHIVPNILMVVGLAAIGTNWFAGRICQDSLDPERFPRWKNFLLAWFALAVLLCSLLVSAMALSYALQGHLEESLKVRACVCALRASACVRVPAVVTRSELRWEGRRRWCCFGERAIRAGDGSQPTVWNAY
jgi:hypothetical protein